MTDHLDDERLSAALDGEADLGDHASCVECQARQEQLRAVSLGLGGVASSVPDSNAAARAAILAGTRAPVVDLASRRRPPTWIFGIAAALIAVVVAVPMLRSGGGGREDTASELAHRGEVPALDGGDLGAIDDEFALQNAIAPSLGADLAKRGEGGSLPGAAGSATDAAGSSDAFAAEAATTTTASGASTAAAPAPQSPRAAISGTKAAACTVQARDLGRDAIGALIYAARVRYKGTSAVALGFEGTGKGSSRTWVFVMARSGCRMLVVQTF